MGLIVDTADIWSLNSFDDAKFSGFWGCEDDQYPSCVKTHTGIVITLGGTPVPWVYKMRKDIFGINIEA